MALSFNANMTPNDVLDFFQSLVDDAPDADGAQVLMDTAYTLRNESRFWAMLMKLDSSIAHPSSDSWTVEKSLPSDFGRFYKAFDGTGGVEVQAVPFERLLQYKGDGLKCAIDLANSKLRFAGPGTGNTLNMWYQYVPTSLIGISDAALALTTTIIWPGRFRPLLAYDMAALYFGGWDSDDVTRQMAPFQIQTAKALERAMIKWDNANKMAMMGNSASPQPLGISDQPDVVSW